MKKLSIISLIFIFYSSLIFSNQEVFSGALAQKPANPASKTARSLATVGFAELPAPAEINVASFQNAALPSSCLGSAEQGKDIVQNAAALNLNQPAGCFDLQIAFHPQTQPALYVRVLPPAAFEIVVVNLPVQIQDLSIASAPLASRTPILPLAFFAAALNFFSLKRRMASGILKAAKNFKISFSLHHLVALRC